MTARLRPYWMLVLAVPALLFGVFYAALGRQDIASGVTVVYPAVRFYNISAETLSTAILLVAGTMLGLWVPQALRRGPRAGLNGLAVALALAGTTLACWGTLPQVFAPYLHLAQASLNGHVYQLGARYLASGNDVYILCQCDSSGWLCQCHTLPAAGQPVTAQTQLVADPASNSLTIQAGSQTVYRFQP